MLEGGTQASEARRESSGLLGSGKGPVQQRRH